MVIVDDEEDLLQLSTRRLERLSYKVYPTTSGTGALQILQREAVDLLITDFRMPGMNGAEVISKALEIDPMLQSIVVTGYTDLKTAIDVMGAGAFNYLPKPVDYNELDIIIQKGLEKKKLLQDVQNKQKQLEEYRIHLETLVEKRTEALTETNQALKKEIEERKQLEISLREAKEIAENASKAKSEFLANMSHEIRTPMTSAIGLLNLVLDTELLPKQKTYLEMARISTVVMHNLLNDILDFSKIEVGKLSLESISFDPRKVIESVVDLQHFQAEEKKIKLFCTMFDEVPASVTGDPNRLRQIILNLVSNAIKFTHYGEVGIVCKKAEQNSNLTFSDEKYSHLHFSVQDSGIGIDKNKIKLIFEAFTQADSSTTREYGGAGLGLNISSKLVDMMGGRIWVESEQGQGSTFHFICRFGKEDVDGVIKVENKINKNSYLPEPEKEQILTVLLVEDNQSNQWVFRELLMKHGYRIVTVSDGATALQEMKNRHFDLVLLDLQIPAMNGYEVVYQIRQGENRSGVAEGQQLPIIGMTGSVGEDEARKCLEAGMNDFIAKPFTAGQLFLKIWKHLRCSSSPHLEKSKEIERKRPNTSVLEREIFNENDALNNASGDRGVMIERIMNFIRTTPRTMEILRNNIVTNERSLLEQGVHRLNELAMEIGATAFADELFSLLSHLRKGQSVKVDQLDVVETEFEYFLNEQNVQTITGE